jgi:hypothetical protein
MDLKVNNGRKDCLFNIDEIEKKRDCKYVGELAIKDKYGNWSADDCVSVFWQEKPPIEGYSNYFALFVRDKKVYITSGASAVEGELVGAIANDGEIIYSRYRHDYRTSNDGSVVIDGGRDYTKTNTDNTITLKILNGKFVNSQHVPIIDYYTSLNKELTTNENLDSKSKKMKI